MNKPANKMVKIKFNKLYGVPLNLTIPTSPSLFVEFPHDIHGLTAFKQFKTEGKKNYGKKKWEGKMTSICEAGGRTNI